MSTKAEVRLCRGSDPQKPHRVTVEFLPKWAVWYVDVNPMTARVRGVPSRTQECSNMEEAKRLAYRLRDEITSGLTVAASVSKV